MDCFGEVGEVRHEPAISVVTAKDASTKSQQASGNQSPTAPPAARGGGWMGEGGREGEQCVDAVWASSVADERRTMTHRLPSFIQLLPFPPSFHRILPCLKAAARSHPHPPPLTPRFGAGYLPPPCPIPTGEGREVDEGEIEIKKKKKKQKKKEGGGVRKTWDRTANARTQTRKENGDDQRHSCQQNRRGDCK
jgi:hypothetical protein